VRARGEFFPQDFGREVFAQMRVGGGLGFLALGGLEFSVRSWRI